MLSRLVSPVPSFLAPLSLPFLLYLRPPPPRTHARTARASASCVFLSLGATLSRSLLLTFPFPSFWAAVGIPSTYRSGSRFFTNRADQTGPNAIGRDDFASIQFNRRNSMTMTTTMMTTLRRRRRKRRRKRRRRRWTMMTADVVVSGANGKAMCAHHTVIVVIVTRARSSLCHDTRGSIAGVVA